MAPLASRTMRLVHEVEVDRGHAPDHRLDGASVDRARRQVGGAERRVRGCPSWCGHVDDPRDAAERSEPDIEALAPRSPRTAASRQFDQVTIFVQPYVVSATVRFGHFLAEKPAVQ